MSRKKGKSRALAAVVLAVLRIAVVLETDISRFGFRVPAGNLFRDEGGNISVPVT